MRSPTERPAELPLRTPARRLALQTMKEALALCVANVFLGVSLTALGWKFFLPSDANSSDLEKMSSRPLVLFLMVVVLAPILEETIFRGTSSLIVRGIWKLRQWSVEARNNWYWIVGSISAFLFSIAHGVGDNRMHLPLPQLIMGFLLWRTAMQRGLRYSMLMHATYNTLPALLMLAQLIFEHKVRH